MANQRNHGDNSPAQRSPSRADVHGNNPRGNDGHGKNVEKQSQQRPNADNQKKHGEPNEQGASGGRRSSDQSGNR